MALISWLPAVIFFIFMTLLYIFARKAYRIIHKILLVFFAINIIFAVLIYLDSKEIEKTLPNSDKLFLLQDNEELLAGFTVNGQRPTFIKEIEQIKQQYAQGQLDDLLGTHYKLMIFDNTIMESQKSININDIEFTNANIRTIMESENALDDLKMMFVTKMGYNESDTTRLNLNGVNSSQEAKTLIFSLVATQTLDKQGFVQLIRDRTLQIYPETITFKFIKYVPEFIAEKMIQEKEVSIV